MSLGRSPSHCRGEACLVPGPVSAQFWSCAAGVRGSRSSVTGSPRVSGPEQASGAERPSRLPRAAGFALSPSAGARWRQAGEEPCASARMRCFIVGGSARLRDQIQETWAGAVSGAAAGVSALRAGPACGTAAAAVVVTSPSVVHSARKAVTIAAHNFMTLL